MKSLIDIADELHVVARLLEAPPVQRLRARGLQDIDNADRWYADRAPVCSTDELLDMRAARSVERDHLCAELIQVASLAKRWVDQMDGQS